jgi:predicted enzyme related to lactoylglutathione lyase
MRYFFLLCSIAVFQAAVAQSSLQNLGWITGEWRSESAKTVTIERWQWVHPGLLSGQAVYMKKDTVDTLFTESLMIVEMGTDMFYIAKVPENPFPVSFKLKAVSDSSVVFENPLHNFPQKVLYQRKSGQLTAVVSNTDSSSPITLNYKLVEQASQKGVLEMKKVTGIGGIFFKCESPEALKAWYRDHLGLKVDEYGAMFEFRKADNPSKRGYLQWSPFSKDTKYFEPSQKDFMINYRVENIEALVEELRIAGVVICDEIATYDYGKFVHIMDPEGNKLELWEPIDSDFTENYKGNTNY